jgi:hypothetical protein
MTISIDVDTLDDEHEQRHDFRRANGSPLVSDPNDPTKSLRYRRPSSYGKPLDDEEALVSWKIFKAMEGVARSPALQAKIIACKDDDKNEKKDLREKALDKGTANERADLGTGLHAMTCRAEDPTDTDFDPGTYREDLDAYLAELDRLGLVSVFKEVQMVNDDFRAAGTADRIYRTTRPLPLPDESIMPTGTLVLGDIKTGAKLDFGLPAYCVQMAIYATGQFYDVLHECRDDTPPIDQRWMLLMHLPVGKAKCEALWLDVNTGLHGAYLTFEVMEWRNRWKSGRAPGYDGYRAVDPVFDAEAAITEAFDADGTIDVAVMVEYCRERIAAIGKHREAREHLLLSWPGDLPTPKQGIHTPEHVVYLLGLLDAVEARFDLPFSVPDPRPTPRRRTADEHVDRSNSRLLLAE